MEDSRVSSSRVTACWMESEEEVERVWSDSGEVERVLEREGESRTGDALSIMRD